MTKQKPIATLLLLLSIIVAAMWPAQPLAAPKKYDFFYHGSNEEGVLLFEPLRPPLFSVEPIGDVEEVTGDDVLRCVAEPNYREALLTATNTLTTVVSMYLRCDQGWFRVKGVKFQ